MLRLYIALHSFADRLRDEERGATATEYAVLIGVVTIVLLAGVQAWFGALSGYFSTVAGRLPL